MVAVIGDRVPFPVNAADMLRDPPGLPIFLFINTNKLLTVYFIPMYVRTCTDAGRVDFSPRA
jgi:hypothetical protein